ncbi:MAG: hypothetical protein CO135_01810 [Candidatus Levybacteria bacterium CG_4_9_14_3_um_filter_35_16]|nr:MAG: hypothetical protein COW87_03700 [Candidatus Levybacteria bacterium CG22_combo_CG10-13_8_21_14_all_35_11]PIY95025.1 MAG: hypothetical protein COY68_00560 [Candidatus Levybacteria bacterium CG_4_10_14_0_8_um_filter_35_23]PIZ97780.1 MAG: hypothetical protein COX78_04280 [Candidatus Levybacteria bacterium CG_4_10_14_0_2_um_filter_35_8]PJA91329.1 MAG: hypothetical protein CO135_01810 [Candidatus Levybacteria bacterium CG_4_9_14_3_um_filter_35_16]PJC54822.1 MAG: hypothetical protein CO028_00
MSEIISLDTNVLSALNFFVKNQPQVFDIEKYNLPFVVGSGNAYHTGQILFGDKSAIYADESNFKKLVSAFKKSIENKLITQAVIISASGGKDSVWEIEEAKKHQLQATLLTTKKDSDAARIADKVYVYDSIDEPYTYNVSTYMGMILSVTKEDPMYIKNIIESLEFPTNFDNYKSYAFIVPDKYMNVCPMLDIKKSELFGPKVSLRAFSQGHARHAKFVIRAKEELVISLGKNNDCFGDPGSRWNIAIPDNLNYAGIMALTYYIVGKIQNSKPQYFKENVSNYVNDYGPKAYGLTKPFDLIVPGSNKLDL